MEKKHLLTSAERGQALLVVLIALLTLLPLCLFAAVSAFRWQQQAIQFRQLSSLEFTVEGAYHDAVLRLQQGRVDLAPGEATRIRVRTDSHPVDLRISRLPDVVVTREGEILEGRAARSADLDAVGMDLRYHRVRLNRALEVYLVEAKVEERSLPATRLRAVVLRAPDGRLQQAGLRVDRVYPPAQKRRLNPVRIETSREKRLTSERRLREADVQAILGTDVSGY